MSARMSIPVNLPGFAYARLLMILNHLDLWWALRGAGPVFGIATRYKARAYPVPVVFAGNLI